jgi:hypothetical protein
MSELLGFWTLSIVQYSKKKPEEHVSETGCFNPQVRTHAHTQSWVLCIGFHGHGLLHKISTSFSISVPSLFMHYHNFYCILLLLSPTDKAWSQVLI